MLNNTLTLQELIDTLENLKEQHGEDIKVVASCDYGDYHHTEQLIQVCEVEVVKPEKSAYSRSGYAFPRNGGDEHEGDSGVELVVVLREAQ